MPGWHEDTIEDQRAGKVQMVGIIEEQHPYRARLFMQWKQMPWPILIDRLNLLEVLAVPITTLIDEYGIVRAVRPSAEQYREFLNTDYPAPAAAGPRTVSAPDLDRLAAEAGKDNIQALRNYAAALLMWGGDGATGRAIQAYSRAVELDPDDGPTQFRLGVAYRMRYDSERHQARDFNQAVEHWGDALKIDPNQYIWRRRIQQYGPRLDKPYSFYDWIHEARKDIVARGETPAALQVEPSGAEFAYPVKEFAAASDTHENPDPDSRIFRDDKGLIGVEITVVPDKLSAGDGGRVHVVFRPNDELKAHWNNEMEDLVFWISPPRGWQVDNRYMTVERPPQPVSKETRSLEFEIKPPEDASGSITIPAYALYYVCEDVNGTCLFRRQDIPVTVRISGGQ